MNLGDDGVVGKLRKLLVEAVEAIEGKCVCDAHSNQSGRGFVSALLLPCAVPLLPSAVQCAGSICCEGKGKETPPMEAPTSNGVSNIWTSAKA